MLQRVAALAVLVSGCSLAWCHQDRVSDLLVAGEKNRRELVSRLEAGPVSERVSAFSRSSDLLKSHGPFFSIEEVRKVVASLDSVFRSKEVKQPVKLQIVKEIVRASMYSFPVLGEIPFKCGTFAGEQNFLHLELSLVLQTHPGLLADAMRLDCETASSVFPILYFVDPKPAREAMLYWLKSGTPREKEAAVVTLLPTMYHPDDGALVRPFLETVDLEKVSHILFLVNPKQQALLFPDKTKQPKAFAWRPSGGR